mgnify:CR=1 FL=1
MFLMLLALLTPIDNRIPIYVLDTGIKEDKSYLCKEYKDMTGKGIKDVANHGWMVADLIGSNIDSTKYCIYMVKWCHTCDNLGTYTDSLAYIIKQQPKYLNISAGGVDRDYFEEKMLKTMVDHGTKITVASGNNKFNLDKRCFYYPACYPINIHVVGALKTNKFDRGNYGHIVKEYLDGFYFDKKTNITYYGTSFSAPRAMARIVNEDR